MLNKFIQKILCQRKTELVLRRTKPQRTCLAEKLIFGDPFNYLHGLAGKILFNLSRLHRCYQRSITLSRNVLNYE